jgi:microcompartment protein CcmL/EutN
MPRTVQHSQAIGLLEVGGYAPALVALDGLAKAAEVSVVQAELNDLLGVCVRVAGDVASVKAGLDAAQRICAEMGAPCVTRVLAKPAAAAGAALFAEPEYSPLIEADVVFFPGRGKPNNESSMKESAMSQENQYAIGLIETQGYVAVIEAIDTACKAANVEVVGREKLGGGFITVIIRGDVAAVRAAVDAGKAKVEGLGKLIAAHVIPRPSAAIVSLLPK